jgi:hypothetical protein
MVESEAEARLKKHITSVQKDVNKLGARVERIHRQVTHPSIAARVKKLSDVSISSLESEITGIQSQVSALQSQFGYWTDYSSSSTIVGWSSLTTQVLQLCILNNMLLVYVNLIGTSNVTTVSFTLSKNSLWSMNIPCLMCMDNGSWKTANGIVSMSGATATCHLDNIGTGWTGSGTKSIEGQFFYRIS